LGHAGAFTTADPGLEFLSLKMQWYKETGGDSLRLRMLNRNVFVTKDRAVIREIV
jgi:hypothetical protein